MRIESVAAEGKSLARIRLNESDEKPIVTFIPYGAPGDLADIQLDRKKNSYAEAHITRLIEGAACRVAPKCEHFGLCGGCKWQHLDYAEQLKWKQQQVEDALTRIAKVEIPEVSPILGSEKIWAYRNKMEYTFSDKKWRTWEEIKSGKEFTDRPEALGFHIPGAFDKVLHIERCLLQDDLGNEIRNFIYDFATACGLSFYNIRDNAGFLNSPNISPGLMIRHGFSTVINATTERNVMVYQQVTLGAGRNGTPTLLEGATVCCGAIVIGGVTIGRNATVGANALVVKDVPDNAIVAGNPAKIIGYNSAGENAGRP